MFGNPLAKKIICLIFSFQLIYIAPVNAGGDPQWGQVGEQLISDVISVGVTVGASVTGNVPLALSAGYVSKYITQYGIAGVKKIIDLIKAYPPRDLGEINLAFIYLIHVKRNLYYTLLEIRKAASPDSANQFLAKELDDLQKNMVERCKNDDCQITDLDESLVNYTFLDIAMNAKQSLEINDFLSRNEIKNTYQYLLLVYFDLLMVEQILIQAQYQLLIDQTVESYDLLKKNAYISNEEKEYQFQLAINLAIRWQLMMDQRRLMLFEVMQGPIEELEQRNQELADDIEGYRK